MDLHHQLRASKARALLVELQGCLKGSVRLELHQHLPGYEPDALTVKLQTNEMVRYPGAAPGYSCFQGKRVLLALSYPMKLDVRPRLALGIAVLQTTGSALCLAHD